MDRYSPAHLIAVIALTIAATILFLGVHSSLGTAESLLIGIPLLLIFPGYVVLYLLSEIAGDQPIENAVERFGFERWDGLTTLAVSIGFSVIVVPIIVRASMAAIGYSRSNVILSLTLFVTILTFIAFYLSDERPATNWISLGEMFRSVREGTRDYFDRGTKFGLATSILLAVSVIFFLSTVTFAIAADPADESYTELYLLTENESDELVANGYSTALNESNSTELIAGIENNEHEAVSYTLVAKEQRLANQSVVEEREILRAQRTIESNEKVRIRHSIETRMTGSNLRVQYYLYRGEALTDETVANAYRTVHLSFEGPG